VSGEGGRGRPLRAATLLIFAALTLALAAGVAPSADARLVGIGERLWPGYAANLRRDPEPPDCELEQLDAQLEQCAATDEAATPAPPSPPVDPFAPQPAAADPFAPQPAAADPFAVQPPAVDPFAAPSVAPTVNCEAVKALRDRCETRQDDYAGRVAAITGPLRTFRAVELAVSRFAEFPYLRHLLALLALLGAATAVGRRVHIALREPRSRLEHAVSQSSQLAAHALWLVSCIADYGVQRASTAEIANPELPILWAVGFVGLAALNVRNLVVGSPSASGSDDKPTSIVRLLMVVPLYAWMGILAGLYFVLVEHHPSGQAIFLHKFVQHPSVYIGIGLYIWAGMLLAETKVAELTFEVLAPWKLPPPMLAWLVVVLAALPTAYSGASGIFVIAAGAVIFGRLRSAGVAPRLALAATAMSGSLGVVLRPCLVVVLIAVLNGKVTTDELFGWGRWVFALTAGLFGLAMWLRSRDSLRIASPKEALPASVRAAVPLLPYLLAGAVVVLIYRLVFDMRVNEHTAALVLPVVLLAMVWHDRRRAPPAAGAAKTTLWRPLSAATSESSGHVGALLMVMIGSVGIGGVVERAELMALVPDSLGSTGMTMAFLVVAMVLVGMTMDALGAVVLVSATIAQLAYQHGIHPAHFWMMVLVAFELGYLTPPVALNHLLARQVIGPDARVEDLPVEGGFLARYEHILLPMAVMGTALVIVAFVPLLFYS
jgi:TRAP-type C4-dicarboxylate transport system permease large subunit